MFEDASSCRHGKQLTRTHTDTHTHPWQMAAIIICHAWESHRTAAGRQSAYSSSSQSSFETSHSLQHRTFFMCTQRERERKRGRKQCDHYMIELCFVVPVAMLTRKIPSPAPGIAPVPSARVEVINFVRKTCCYALGKHIMAISCQFATHSPPPTHWLATSD